MRQTVEDPRVLWYRVLLRKLLTARHCGEPLSAENPNRSVSLTRQDMLRASELQSENSKLIGAELRETINNGHCVTEPLYFTNVKPEFLFAPAN